MTNQAEIRSLSDGRLGRSAQLQRLTAAADSLACGLDDLCTVLHRELGPEFQPVYELVNRASDALDEFRTAKGWSA